MAEKGKTNKALTLDIGLGVGMILYKVIFELLWPMIFG